MFLRQSTITTVLVGPLLSATDGVTPVTGGLGTVYVSKAGAAQVARNSATAITHDRDGYYRVALSGTDTSAVGPLLIQAAPAGAVPVWMTYDILPAAVYDALVAGTVNLPAAVASMGADVLDAAALKADATAEIADALLDRANGVETGYTPRQVLRLLAAAFFGKASGGGTTTLVFRDLADSKARITMTVDGSGNRSAVTRDAS